MYSTVAYSAPMVYDIYKKGHTAVNLEYYFKNVYKSAKEFGDGIQDLKKCLKYDD